MPNRIIKESIRSSETVGEMSDFEFRLWVNMITVADDYGRCKANPKLLRGVCFALRDEVTPQMVTKALKHLAQIGAIKLYEVSGTSYLEFCSWDKHQTVRNKNSKCPSPEEAQSDAIESSCMQLRANDCNCMQEQSDESNCVSNPIQSNTIQSESESNQNTNPKRFVKPSVEDVINYIQENAYRVDAEEFWNYYESNGWMVGKTHMKDWKACIRTWDKRYRDDRRHRTNDNVFLGLLESEHE